MARPDFLVSIVEFQRRFCDELACLEYLAASRWPGGFCCPACGWDQAWVLARRHVWECAWCRRQTSVTCRDRVAQHPDAVDAVVWAAFVRSTHTRGSRQPACSARWASGTMRRPG